MNGGKVNDDDDDEVFRSVEAARGVLASLMAQVATHVREASAHLSPPERQCILKQDPAEGDLTSQQALVGELSIVAHMVLGAAARATLAHTDRAAWTPDQIARATRPGLVFDGTTPPALPVPGTDEANASKLARERFENDIEVQTLRAALPHVKSVSEDVRANLIMLTRLGSDVYVRPRSVPSASSGGGDSGGWRCMLTGRVLAPGTPALEVRTRFQWKESVGVTAPPLRYVGFMDARPLPQAPTHRPRHQQPSPPPVSPADLGCTLLSFSTVCRYIEERAHADCIRESVLCASGAASHDVLEAQRQQRGRRRGGAVVLKKNKPDQVEQWFRAWELCTFSQVALERIVDIYQHVKDQQVALCDAVHRLDAIRSS